MRDSFWEEELRDLDLSGLDGPADFAERLDAHPGFNAIAAAVVAEWPNLSAERRTEVYGMISTVALAALPDVLTPEAATAVGEAVLLLLRRRAARAFSEGSLSEDSLREFVGILPETTLRQIIGDLLPKRPPRAPRGPRALRYPEAYYTDALTLSLPTWASKWWPDFDLDADYDRLAERRRRARRSARARGLEKGNE